MKLAIKYLSLLFILLFGFYNFSIWTNKKKKETLELVKKQDSEAVFNRLSNESKKIKSFVSQNEEYNNDITFLIDMKIESNKNRFFVYNLKENKIIDKGLVAHGSGSEENRTSSGDLFFSNENNSLCTSLGRYEIQNSYYGTYGKAYKLKGLDKTNNNAILRNIVLHKYNKMPLNEQKSEICLSYGCPMVNEKFFNKLEKIIDQSDKTIVLFIYY